MRLRWPVALAAAALLAAGCGGGDGNAGIASLEGQDAGTTTTTAGATLDREQALLQFAQCMRDQGIEMEDPTADESGSFQMMRPSEGGEGGEFEPADREAVRAAREACSQHLEGIAQAFDRPDMTEMQDLMLEYAACMRDNGVDMPDPDFSEASDPGGQGPGARLGFDPGDFDPNDPTFQAANEACRDIFGAQEMPGFMGGGPGGGMPPGGTPPAESPIPDTDG